MFLFPVSLSSPPGKDNLCANVLMVPLSLMSQIFLTLCVVDRNVL